LQKIIFKTLKTFDIVVKTLFGLEDVLTEELKQLGVLETEKLSRAVKFKGNQELMYKCNLHLRTALKVLKPIATFQAKNENELYDKVKQIDWSEYLTVKQTFAIDGTTTGEVFTHSKYIALKTKDAIADQFREQKGIRPSVDTENPDLSINIHISDINCTISLDSSGTHLGKRGYRLHQVLAPLSENLAAGLILLSSWDRKSDFIDPMCGSGTIAIEAALIAKNIAPGKFRNFNFEKWNDFDGTIWNRIKEKAKDDEIEFTGKIYAHDIDIKAVEIAARNAERAEVDDYIDIEKKDFFESDISMNNGIIIMNPPYGERLNEESEIVPMYKKIGDKLKQSFNGCDAWIISGNLNAIKFIGLRPSRKIHIFNGPIECRFNKFELYRGSKKDMYENKI